MKKCVLFIAGLIALLVSSCVDETFENYSVKDLLVTGSIDAGSRTTFVHGDGVVETHWETTDYIGLFSDGENNFRYKSQNYGKSTEFKPITWRQEIAPEEGKEVYAYFPYQYNEKKIDSIPCGSAGFIYSKAQIKDGKLNFQFKHLYAYLKAVISTQDIKEHLAKAQECVGDHTLNTNNANIQLICKEADISPEAGSYFNLKTNELSGKFSKFINISLYGLDMSKDSTYTFMIPILPQPEGIEITGQITFSDENGYRYTNYNSPYFFKKKAPEGGFQAGHVYKCNDFFSEESHEETLKVLKSLYQKTGGDQWTNKENWFSEKPLSEWYGINYVSEKTHKIHSIELDDNNLKGPFPEELAYLADFVDEDYIHYAFSFNHNYFYGTIPDALKKHKYWNIWGWNLVTYQNVTEEGAVDLSNSNLYIENLQMEDLLSETASVCELYDIFKKNKLTQLLFIEIDGSDESNIDLIKTAMGSYRVNQHLDFQSKGFGTIVVLLTYDNQMNENQMNEIKNAIKDVYGEVDGVGWYTTKYIGMRSYADGATIYDCNGQYVYNSNYNPICYQPLEVLERERCDKYLRSVFGEPVKHSEFIVDTYTSEDFSRDGEVVTLQKATVGQGINLVFLGEAFVDKDMARGGLYEKSMRQAMEQFFSIEPYKSMRDRFNVYTVKAVSPSTSMGYPHAINHSNGKCFKYAEKIPNANNNPLMVSVIYNGVILSDGHGGKSHCYMLEDGSFISYLYHGIHESSILMHETGGHGFGQLQDEYVESGNETVALPEEEKSKMDRQWTDFGMGANVDWRNDITTVKWSHFLNDSRYANEGLGLYEGAFLYGYGVYRPTENSMMRYNTVPFNAPSREAIYKRIMKLSEGDDWTYDYEEFVKYDETNRNAVSRSVVKPLTDTEKKEYAKKHCPPILLKGTWRDVLKNDNRNIVVPFR